MDDAGNNNGGANGDEKDDGEEEQSNMQKAAVDTVAVDGGNNRNRVDSKRSFIAISESEPARSESMPNFLKTCAGEEFFYSIAKRRSGGTLLARPANV
jgi:hypothetical protein